MRTLNLQAGPSAPEQSPLLARLTRHLQARLLDFGPGGPVVLSADQTRGMVVADFPGHAVSAVLEQLAARFGIAAQLEEEEKAGFYLSPGVGFEDLDYLWGCLFQLLYD